MKRSGSFCTTDEVKTRFFEDNTRYHLLRYDRDFNTLFEGIEWQDSVLTTSLDDNRETEKVLDAPDTLSSEHSDTKKIVDPTDEEIREFLHHRRGQNEVF